MNKKAQNLKTQMTQISGQMEFIRSALKADGWKDIRKKLKQACLQAFKTDDWSCKGIFVTCHSSFDWRVTSWSYRSVIHGQRINSVDDITIARIQKIVNDALAALKKQKSDRIQESDRLPN